MMLVGLIASAPLQWLEPFISLGSAFASIVQMVLVVGALLVFLAPMVVAIASCRWSGLYLRLPILWPLPSVVGAIAIVRSVPGDGQSWFWCLVPYAVFSSIATVIGSIHLLIRSGHVVFKDQVDTGGFERALSRLVYGWGAAAAGFSLIVAALILEGLSVGAYGLLIVVFGVWVARGEHQSTNKLARGKVWRIVWLVGVALTAVMGLFAYTAAVWIAFDDAVEYTMNTRGGWLLNALFFFESVGVLLAYRFWPFEKE